MPDHVSSFNKLSIASVLSKVEPYPKRMCTMRMILTVTLFFVPVILLAQQPQMPPAPPPLPIPEKVANLPAATVQAIERDIAALAGLGYNRDQILTYLSQKYVGSAQVAPQSTPIQTNIVVQQPQQSPIVIPSPYGYAYPVYIGVGGGGYGGDCGNGNCGNGGYGGGNGNGGNGGGNGGGGYGGKGSGITNQQIRNIVNSNNKIGNNSGNRVNSPNQIANGNGNHQQANGNRANAKTGHQMNTAHHQANGGHQAGHGGNNHASGHGHASGGHKGGGGGKHK
jgi:hypothetical protein